MKHDEPVIFSADCAASGMNELSRQDSVAVRPHGVRSMSDRRPATVGPIPEPGYRARLLAAKRFMSVGNLNSRTRPSGQIATFLLLIISVVIIFMLATTNLGQVSLKATTVSNAADAATLYLGSQLATKSNLLYRALGNRSAKCRRSMFLIFFLAVVFALLSIYNPTFASFFGAGAHASVIAVATAGAVGGAIGGAIVYGNLKGALLGGLIGFGIGASIGYGYHAFGTQTQAPTALNKAQGLAKLLEGTAQSINEGLCMMSTVTSFSAGAAATGAALASGAALFNGIMQEKMANSAIAAAAKALNGLPDYLRIQQGTIYEGLIRTVDDPTMVVDVTDVDGDGDKTNLVPAFAKWWDDRIQTIKAAHPPTDATAINTFLGKLKIFHDQLVKRLGAGGTLGRCDVEKADGFPLKVFRKLEHDSSSCPGLQPAANNVTIDLSFWAPGPSKAELDTIEKCEQKLQDEPLAPCDKDPATCEAESNDPCGTPRGWDQVDQMHDELDAIRASAEELLDTHNRGQVIDSWRVWIALFYDPNDDTYDQMITEIQQWQAELTASKPKLPECVPPTPGPPPTSCPAPGPARANYCAQACLPCKAVGGDLAAYICATDCNQQNCKLASCAVSPVKQCLDKCENTYNACFDWCKKTKGGFDRIYCIAACGRARDACRKPCGSSSASLLESDAGQSVESADQSFAGDAAGSSTLIRASASASASCSTTIYPCKMSNQPPFPYGTIGDTTYPCHPDDFVLVNQELDGLINEIKAFRDAAKLLFGIGQANPDNTNPAVYQWDDSQGHHKVQVGVGPFKIPYIRKTGHGWLGKRCLRITDGRTSHGNPLGAYVIVTRSDPPSVGGGLWEWNPFNGRVCKAAAAAYSWTSIGLNSGVPKSACR